MNRWMRLLIILCVISVGDAAAACLKYETVSITGTLVRQTYAGPPDYDSVTKGDEPSVIWIIQLDAGLCVVDPDPRYPKEYNELEVQLVAGGQSLRFQQLLGKRVIATGKLLPGGAKYDKRLVLSATEIKKTGVLR